MSAALSGELQARLGLAEGALAVQLSRLGRRVPRGVRHALEEVAEAERLAANPRLLPRIDPQRLEAAHRRALSWLKALDPAARRAQRRRALAAEVALNLGLGTAAVIAALALAGRIGPGAG
ncbi:hypothetical protein [Mangrovicoccus algicola]|uniref:Uncharacterized protein n=1 Tax=Mangrovicoccus algicola TaxID=2771008 RepID=A0A8J6YY22_9RHOB|nr:hypothetical protein [Mangrovicoccus algicola]MBE3639862.1 hypothetical protein [Mangrovicoccus algicola]